MIRIFFGSKRPTLIATAALLALFGGACTSDDGNDEVDATPSPETSVATPSISAGGEFDPGTVVKTVAGDDTLIVHLIDETAVDDPAAVLEECTTAYGGEADAVTCYLFESAEAFDAARVSEEDDAMENQCWSAYFGMGKDGGRGQLENPDYDEVNCP